MNISKENDLNTQAVLAMRGSGYYSQRTAGAKIASETKTSERTCEPCPDGSFSTEENADTICKKIYHTILNMYVDPKNEKEHHDIYFKLVKELFNAAPNQVILALTMEVSQKILEGNHYQAVKICKKLLNFEAELLANVPG